MNEFESESKVVLTVDVPTVIFDKMSSTSEWIMDDEKFKNIILVTNPHQVSYVYLIRERIQSIQTKVIILFNIKDNRLTLLTTM